MNFWCVSCMTTGTSSSILTHSKKYKTIKKKKRIKNVHEKHKTCLKKTQQLHTHSYEPMCIEWEMIAQLLNMRVEQPCPFLHRFEDV